MKHNSFAVVKARPCLGFLGYVLGGSILFWVTCIALALVAASGCASSRGGIGGVAGGAYGSAPTMLGAPGPAVVSLPLMEAYIFRGPVLYNGRPWGEDQVMTHHEPLVANAGVMQILGAEYAGIVPPYVDGFGFNAEDVTAVFEQGSTGDLPVGNRARLVAVDVPVGGRVRKGYGLRLCPAGNPQSGRDNTFGVNNASFSFEVTYRGIGGTSQVRHWGPFRVTGQ